MSDREDLDERDAETGSVASESSDSSESSNDAGTAPAPSTDLKKKQKSASKISIPSSREELSLHSRHRALAGHTDCVRAVLASPNGRTIASGSDDETVRLWDAETGEELRTLKGHKGGIASVAWAPDGRRLASASYDETVRLWDTSTGKTLCTLAGEVGQVFSVAWAPDGKTLASGNWDKTTRLWDAATGKELCVLNGHTDFVMSVAWAPNSQMLASSSWEKSVRLWDIATGKTLRVLTGHAGVVASVAWAPDGQMLASASFDTTVRLWDVPTGKLVCALKGHTGEVHSVAWSLDGQMLASASGDETVRLWNSSTGHALRALTGHTREIYAVSWALDGLSLASGSNDKNVRLWELSTGKELRPLTGHSRGVTSIAGSVMSVAWAPDGQTLASASEDKTVRRWDAATGKELRALIGHDGDVTSVAWAPDGQSLASGSDDKTVRLWDPVAGVELLTLNGHTNGVLSVAWMPDGRRLASASLDKTVRVWDTKTAKELHILTGHTRGVSSVACAPDGLKLVSASHDETVLLWNLTTGKLLHKMTGHQAEVYSVAWSLDGLIIASGSDDKTVRLWDAVKGKRLHTLTGHTNCVMSVAWAPDSQTLASTSDDRTIRLWDVAACKELRKLTGHTDDVVMTVAWAPDGRTLASGSDDKTLRLWDAATGKDFRTLKGHTGGVATVAWAPNGRTLASTSDDRMVRLWDTMTGNKLRTLVGHTGYILLVAWAPDGQMLASASADNTVRLWDAVTGHELCMMAWHTSYVLSVAWAPDGQTLASASADRTVRLCDAAGNELRSLTGHTGGVTAVAWAPNGEVLASVSADKTVRLWDVMMGIELHTLTGHARDVTSVAWSNDGKSLASACGDKVVRLWDAETGVGFVVESDQDHTNSTLVLASAVQSVSNLRFGPLAKISLDGSLVVITAQEGNPPFSPISFSHASEVKCVAFSPVFPVFAIGLEDGSILMQHYDDLIGACLATNPTHILPTWYMSNLLCQQKNDVAFFSLLRNNSSSLYFSEYFAATRGDCFRQLIEHADFSWKLNVFHQLLPGPDDADRARHFFHFGNLLRLTLESTSSDKADVFLFLLEQLSMRVNAGDLFSTDDPVFAVLAEAVANKEANLQSQVNSFFLKTKLRACVQPVAMHEFKDGSAVFAADGTLVTSVSDCVGQPRIPWCEYPFASKSGGKGVSEALVTPFPGIAAAPGPDKKNKPVLLTALVAAGSADAFDTLFLRTVIDFKWQAYGAAKFNVQFLIYVLGLMVLVALSLLVSGTFQRNLMLRFREHNNGDVAALTCAFLTLAWLLYTGVREGIQVVRNGRDYFSDIWNWLDLAHLGFGVTALVCFVFGRNSVTLFLALAVYARWFGLLYFLQAFNSTGSLIRMILQILVDMRWFIFVLAIGVLATANAFYVLLQHDPSVTNVSKAYGGVQGFNDPADALFTMFNMLMISSYTLSDFVHGPYQIAIQLMFVVSMIMVPIVLLNLLIALMNDSFEHIQDEAVKQLNFLKAKILVEQESFFSQKDFARADWFPKYIHVMVPRGENKPLGKVGEYMGMLNELKAKFADADAHVDVKVKAVKVDVASVDTKVAQLTDGMGAILTTLESIGAGAKAATSKAAFITSAFAPAADVVVDIAAVKAELSILKTQLVAQASAQTAAHTVQAENMQKLFSMVALLQSSLNENHRSAAAPASTTSGRRV